MIKKSILVSLVLPCLVTLPAQTPKPTPAKVEALVNAAVTYAKEHGKDQLIVQTNLPHGLFHVGTGAELYIFVYDHKGTCKAIGFDTDAVVGTNRWELKDSDGVFFVRKIITTARTNKAGWTDYKYPNPMTKTIQGKSSYAVAFDDLVIGSGLYKD